MRHPGRARRIRDLLLETKAAGTKVTRREVEALALAQAKQFHDAVGVTGLVLTKLDGTAKGGIVLAIAKQLGLPIRFIGIGEGADDFGEFDAAAFAAALIDGE